MKTMTIPTEDASVLTNTRTVSRTSVTGPLVRRGLVAGVAAAAATTAVAAVASAADVSLQISGEAIPVLSFGQLTFMASIVGTILAVVLAKRADRPRHTFVVSTIVLTCLSIVPDAIVDAEVSTKLVLALTHVVAASIVIPALAARLAVGRTD